MESILIRPKTAADEAWAVGFLKCQFNGTYLPEFFSEKSLSNFLALVAEIDGEPVGLLTYHIQSDACHIVSLNVSRKRIGVGESLLNRLEAEALAHACKKLICTISNDNLNALRFLQKRDFHLVAIRADAIEERRRQNPTIQLKGEYGIPLRDELVLERDLAK